MSQAPALAFVTKPLLGIEVFQAVNEADTALPGQLDQPPVVLGQTFGEELSRQRPQLLHPAGLELDPAHRRLAATTGAFVQEAVMKDQPLGEGIGVVRVAGDDLWNPGFDIVRRGARAAGAERQ